MWIGVAWILLGPREGILIMWDNRMVEKVEECAGAYTLVVTFRNVVDCAVWAFAGVVRTLIGIEGFFGMSWRAFSVCGICRGV